MYSYVSRRALGPSSLDCQLSMAQDQNLYDAAKGEFDEIGLKELLEQGADLNWSNPQEVRAQVGITPLTDSWWSLCKS